ncbi:MAG: hypothetical protein Ct9H300mP13_6290 [Gammaproteobacteria bacterium]|nr:MAG: hypothetical protein Ct9H300mP13_6290 [Gammaproteobacteria bacterium]
MAIGWEDKIPAIVKTRHELIIFKRIDMKDMTGDISSM